MKSDNKSPFCGSCPVISNLHIMEMCAHVNVSQTTVKLHAKCKQGDENKQQQHQHFISEGGRASLPLESLLPARIELETKSFPHFLYTQFVWHFY